MTLMTFKVNVRKINPGVTTTFITCIKALHTFTGSPYFVNSFQVNFFFSFYKSLVSQ